MSEQRRQLVVGTIGGAAPEVGRWLWAIEDARRRTLETLDGLAPEAVDWRAPDGSTIGMLLYHVALIEADWLYAEALEQPYPELVITLLPHDHRDADGHLTVVRGETLAQHLDRLATIRGLLLDAFGAMSSDEFRHVHHLPEYDVTPEWVLHHLMQHEAEHRSQIGSLRAQFERERFTE